MLPMQTSLPASTDCGEGSADGQVNRMTTQHTSSALAPEPAATPMSSTAQVAYLCKHCDFSSYYFSRFAKHVKEYHPGIKEYSCAICKVTFAALSRYKTHYDECHGPAQISEEIHGHTELSGLESGESYAESLNMDTSLEPDVLALSDEDRMSDLCRLLEGKHRCSKTVVDTVVKGVSNLFYAKGLHFDVFNLNSDKARKRLYEANCIYVKPNEIVLSNGSRAYYVPLKSLLQNLFRHPEGAAYLQRRFSFSEDGFLRDICDGVRFKSRAEFKQENALGVMLYCDDVEIANPLGMKRGTCGKLTLFYVTFANFPVSKRSQLNSIFLLAVANSRDLKTSATKTELLQDFVEAMNELAGRGISVQVKEGEIRAKGGLVAFLGDSLASSAIAGFKESFSPNVRYACRRCKARTCDFPNIFLHSDCPLRTDREIEAKVQQLLSTENKAERKEVSASSGIKGPSVLGLVTGFSLTRDVLFDPMHILLEGIIPKEISLFMRHQIHTLRSFSRKQLNDSLKAFKFHHSISTSEYPRMFDASLQLVSSASATAILVVHLPLILNNIVSVNVLGPTYECLILICQIMQLILSPVLSIDALGTLESLIINHQKLFLSCYGEQAFTPKLHMLIHMVDQIKEYGPGHHHWTMRYEGKNALPKSKKLFNFKNVPFSVSEFFQINLSHSMWHGNGEAKISFLDGTNEDQSGIPYPLSPAFVQAGLPVSSLDSVGQSVQSVMCDNVVIKVNDIMMTQTVSGDAGFLKITVIVQFLKQVFFVCHVMVMEAFDTNLNCFVLRATNHELVVSKKKFLLSWPLYVYKHDSVFYCLPRYYPSLP